MVYTVKIKDDHYIPFIRDYSETGTFLNGRLIGKRRSVALFSGCLITIACPEIQFFYVPREVLGGPHDEPFEDAPLLYAEKIKRSHGHWDLIRLPDQLGYIRDKVGGVYLSIPYALPTGTRAFQLACKIIRVPPHPIPGTDNSYARYLIEVEILKQCRHPTMPILVEYGVKLINKFYFCHIFTPLAAGATLENIIERSCQSQAPGIERPKALFIFLQLLEGIHYLHNAGRPKKEAAYVKGGPKLTPESSGGPRSSFFHGELKPANILVMEDTEYPRVIINDFGCAKRLEDNLYLGDEGTMAYWSLERFAYRTYSIKELQAIDIWALGVTFYEMVAGQHPFVPQSMRNNMSQMHTGLLLRQPSYLEGQFESYYVEDAEFISKMLVMEPEDRATSSQLLKLLLLYTSNDPMYYHRMRFCWDDYVGDRRMYQGDVVPSEPYEYNLTEDEINEIRERRQWFIYYKSARNDPDRRLLSEDDFEIMSRISMAPSGYSGKHFTLPLEFLNGESMHPDVQSTQEVPEVLRLRDSIPFLSPPGDSSGQTMDETSVNQHQDSVGTIPSQ
ncbi:kinase-like domain-containing protein [Fennellomyces sp. T-0311]|nr:kinase-like domain-containing protein [Fennellomyces sp. T-0311]